jgi:hypothetical protein
MVSTELFDASHLVMTGTLVTPAFTAAFFAVVGVRTNFRTAKSKVAWRAFYENNGKKDYIIYMHLVVLE